MKLVETAARGVARFLQVDQYPMDITGCWANVNPPGAYHPMHHHPNNYLSGVYYVAVPTAGSQIVFQDPRAGLDDHAQAAASTRGSPPTAPTRRARKAGC